MSGGQGRTAGGQRKATGGFTLLELVVALLLVAVMTPLLLGALRVGAGASGALEERTRAARDLHLAGAFLARRLEQAQPGGFAGGPHALRFVAALPAHLGAGGMYAFSLGLAPDGGELVLAYELYQDAHWERFAAVAPQRTVLASGLRELRFDYFDTGWAPRWEARGTLPRLVRVRFLAGEQPYELVIAPRIGVSRPDS